MKIQKFILHPLTPFKLWHFCGFYTREDLKWTSPLNPRETASIKELHKRAYVNLYRDKCDLL